MPGLRCMGSDVFCLMEEHFLCFVEAAYIPSAALELFVTACLTPGAGQAGALAPIWRWTVLKRKVKRGSAALKRGLGYFKHNTSFKVKRLSCNTLQRQRSSSFQDSSGVPESVPEAAEAPRICSVECFPFKAFEAETPQSLASALSTVSACVSTLKCKIKCRLRSPWTRETWGKYRHDGAVFCRQGTGMEASPCPLASVQYRLQEPAIDPGLRGQKPGEFGTSFPKSRLDGVRWKYGMDSYPLLFSHASCHRLGCLVFLGPSAEFWWRVWEVFKATTAGSSLLQTRLKCLNCTSNI